ncbi:hypothetical protein MKZ02_19680 [Pseudobacillus sp. FSL P4-0506]|uniref:hypothetical protein n=1 Tax=Pseudobacillus sp. FSL P4-0506 TaxID=2921576 RepID=UPI0030FB89D6
MSNIIKQEIAERKCAHSLIYRIEECVVAGDLKEAKRSIKDLEKSIEELEKMQNAKENRKRLEEVVQHLNKQGVLTERIIKVV